MGTERRQHRHRSGAKRIAVVATLVAFGVTGFVGAGAFAASNDEFVPGSTIGPGDHVPLCHAHDGGGYVLVAPSSGAVFGHAGHQDGRDVIPPFVFQPNGPHQEPNTSLAGGQNWDAAGQALWARGCVAETTPTETTPTETTPTETTPTETTPTETTPTETTPTVTTPTETSPTPTTPTQTTGSTPSEPTQPTPPQPTPTQPTQPTQPAQPAQPAQPQPTPPRQPTQSKPKPKPKPKPTRKPAAAAAHTSRASAPAELAYTP